MNKRSQKLISYDQARRDRLNQIINETFGNPEQDEAHSSKDPHEATETRMFEIAEVRAKSCIAMDLFEDLEFKPVHFPEKLTPLLRKHDVFFGTICQKDSTWQVIYMSPLYERESCEG